MLETTSFKALKDQYFLLDRNFNKLFAACTTPDEQNSLRRDYVNSRDNFWEARGRVFAENEPVVKALNTELDDAQSSIEKSLTNLKNISQVLAVITAAVRVGSSLITMGSSLA